MTTETYSIALDDMSVEQLVQLSQGLGHQIEKLREQRMYLRKKIDERLMAEQRAGIEAQIAALQGQLNATAPGVVMDATSSAPTKRAKNR